VSTDLVDASRAAPGQSLRDAMRAVRRAFADGDVMDAGAGDVSMRDGGLVDPPVVRSAPLLEGSAMRAISIDGPVAPVFSGFLDGVQTAKILKHIDGVPLVYGRVAAVIRTRSDRTLVTWPRHAARVDGAIYVPLRQLQEADRDAVSAMGVRVTDTSMLANEQPVSAHPGAMRAAALEKIGRARETLEQALAAAWCATEATPLFVDGSIRGSDALAAASCVVGVVKSHNTLHADGPALRTVMRLARGERSSVFSVQGGRRPNAASWYLRLRDPRGQDAMFGLVRVEVAEDGGDYAARANEVSRWILAEVAPLALPDGRWDKMVYGIRDCEAYLRAMAS